MVILPQQNDHFELERPRANTLVDPPLGGQSAIGVAQSDHEAPQRDSFYGKELAFYLDRTTTLVANGSVSPPWSSPPWEANLQ